MLGTYSVHGHKGNAVSAMELLRTGVWESLDPVGEQGNFIKEN